jgi:hypothetical protein
VLVFRPVVDEQQEPDGRQTLDQAVEEHLGLVVDPVEALEHDQQRLNLALAQQEPLDPVEGLLAPLGRVEPLPRGVVDGHVEQPEERRECGLQGPVQGEELAGDLLADLAGVIARLELEVAPEQVEDREEGRHLAVGDGIRLDEKPAVEAVGVGELPEQARLADAGLADDGHELAPAAAGALEGVAELVQLRVTTDVARETAGGRGLQPRANGGGSDELVDLERHGEPLDHHGAEWRDLHVPLGEAQGIGGEQDRAGDGQLLHPRGEVGGLPNGGVIHVEVRADGADDDLAGV